MSTLSIHGKRIGAPPHPRPNVHDLPPRERAYAMGRLVERVPTFGSAAGCWLWVGDKNRGGYGRVNVWGGKMTAHRLSWIIHRGGLTERDVVLHSCDTPACVRPDHLSIGTHSSNHADMCAKGRNSCQDMRGEGNPRARLFEEDVRCMRVRHAEGDPTAALATEYGIDYRHAFKLLHGRIWRHVEGACPIPCALIAAGAARR